MFNCCFLAQESVEILPRLFGGRLDIAVATLLEVGVPSRVLLGGVGCWGVTKLQGGLGSVGLRDTSVLRAIKRQHLEAGIATSGHRQRLDGCMALIEVGGVGTGTIKRH